jgi:hypothetical protein
MQGQQEAVDRFSAWGLMFNTLGNSGARAMAMAGMLQPTWLLMRYTYQHNQSYTPALISMPQVQAMLSEPLFQRFKVNPGGGV